MRDQAMHHGLSVGLCQAIGELTVEWSFLEWQLESSLWLLLSTSETEGRVVTAPMNFRPKALNVASLVRLRSDEADSARVDRLMNAILKADEERNRVVHGVWAESKQAGAYRLTWPGGNEDNGIGSPASVVNLEDVQRMVDRVKQLNKEMAGLRLYLLSVGLRAFSGASPELP